jgi:DNA mismatch repair protein MutS
MKETSYILENATRKSLIILDELGRGTSTFDGLSLAFSIAEYIYKNIKARTLFATHYHELTGLPKLYQGIKNYNIAVKQKGHEIFFLRKLVEGGVNKSYGIHVARLAGLPSKVLTNAEGKLKELEENTKDGAQLSLFPASSEAASDTAETYGEKYASLIEDLKAFDVTNSSPLEALIFIEKLKNVLKSSS